MVIIEYVIIFHVGILIITLMRVEMKGKCHELREMRKKVEKMETENGNNTFKM